MPVSSFLLFAVGAASSMAHARLSIDVTDFGALPDSGQDATVPFQRAIAAAKAAGKPVTLVVPRGRYDFFSAHATRRPGYYSNATEKGSNAMRTIALDLSGLKDVTVEGTGARLVMRGLMTMVVAERSAKLRLQGLEFDFARPPVSEITAIEKGDGYWVGQVHPDSDFRIVGRRIQWYGEDWSNFHNLVQHFDPVAGMVWRGGDPTANVQAITELGGRRLRFAAPAESLAQVVVGRTYQFRETTRSETGMWFNRSHDVSLENVRVRAMAGFGMLFQFTENVDLKHVTVAPTPGSHRTCVAAADILHFSGCRGKVRVSDCVLTSANDDAMNVHGTHLRVVGTPGERQIRVRFMHDQTWGFAAFSEGDEIEFVRPDTLRPYAKARVKHLKMEEDPREQTLTLDRDLPAELKLGSDAVENVTWTPSVEVTGCEIAWLPTRGILVTTRRPVRIVGNRFHRTPGPSVLVEDDAAGWYESGSVQDLLIRANTFFGGGEEAIRIHPENSVNGGAVHRNVRIEGNEFLLTHLPAISVKGVEGLTVTGNRFRVDGKPVANPPELVRTSDTTNVRMEQNAG